MDNKVSLHLGKNETILLGSKNKLNFADSLNVKCNTTEIQSTSSVTYLGANLDQCFSGDAMAPSVVQKANSRLKFLYRKWSYLTKHTKRLLVMSLIQCYFDYACSFWFTGLSMKWKQNMCTRFITI